MKTRLHQITTKDKLVLEGLLFEPERKSDTALVFIHGLTSTFYGGVKRLNTLAETATQNGIAVASFNNRGHDIITSARKIDRRRKKGYTHKDIGAAQEVFQECVFDIGAVVEFLKSKGYKKIFLAGHSTGANKAVYFMDKTRGRDVTGIILLGPLSDVTGAKAGLGENYGKVIRLARRKIKSGEGNTLMLHEALDFPKTAKRLLSLAVPNSTEDVFQYHLEKPRFTAFKSIKKPLLIIFGENDQYTPPYTVAEIMESYNKYTQSKKFRSVIIPETDHSFNGKEKELAKTVVSWVKEASS